MNGLALPRGIESLHRSRCYDPRNRRVPGQSRQGEVLRELIRTPASHVGSVRTIRRLRIRSVSDGVVLWCAPLVLRRPLDMYFLIPLYD